MIVETLGSLAKYYAALWSSFKRCPKYALGLLSKGVCIYKFNNDKCRAEMTVIILLTIKIDKKKKKNHFIQNIAPQVACNSYEHS